MKTVIFGDSHIKKGNLWELDKIFEEIEDYLDKNTILICLGDYYERNILDSESLDFGTRWAKRYKDKVKKYYMITGNHTAYSKDITSVTYLNKLDIEVVNELELDDMFFGHFCVKEARKGFGSNISIKDLRKYKYVFLGHQHRYEKIENIYQLGSIIYEKFDEVGEDKRIAVIEDDRVSIIKLTSPVKMYDACSIERLVDIPVNTKVRYTVQDYNRFLSEAEKIMEIVRKKSFITFKFKYDIKEEKKDIEKIEIINLKEYLYKRIKEIENKEVKKELLEIIGDIVE